MGEKRSRLKRMGTMGAAPAHVLASLLENGDEEGHVDEIHRHLAHATHVICIVTFAKYTGWQLIKNVLRERAAKGLTVWTWPT